jgi:DNA-binding transcriptional regulator LsrR (DeoR family)
MVEVTIRLPFPNLFELETKLQNISNLKDVIVTPTMENSKEGTLSLLAQSAANYLVSQLRARDRICIGGGRTLHEVVNHVKPHKLSGIQIYSAMGGIQRDPALDLNALASQLAQKLGGETFQFYAPGFAETEDERNTLTGLSHVTKAIDDARSARVALFGIGTLQINASIIQYCSIPYWKLAELVKQGGGVGEILALPFDSNGTSCVPELHKLHIGLGLEDIRNVDVRIGVACGSEKSAAIAAAIRGNYFTSLVIDEGAAQEALQILETSGASAVVAAGA